MSALDHGQRRHAEDYIPADILAAAKAAGLTTPLWYVGRRSGHRTLETGLGAVVAQSRREQGLPVEFADPVPNRAPRV